MDGRQVGEADTRVTYVTWIDSMKGCSGHPASVTVGVEGANQRLPSLTPSPSRLANEPGGPGRPRWEKIPNGPSGVPRPLGLGGVLGLTRQGPESHQASPNAKSPSSITIIILKTNPPAQWMAWRRGTEHLRCEPLGVPDRCALPSLAPPSCK